MYSIKDTFSILFKAICHLVLTKLSFVDHNILFTPLIKCCLFKSSILMNKAYIVGKKLELDEFLIPSNQAPTLDLELYSLLTFIL